MRITAPHDPYLAKGLDLVVLFYSIFIGGGSSVGRALRSQCRGRGFDSLPLHHFSFSGSVHRVPRPVANSSHKTGKRKMVVLLEQGQNFLPG